jgi:phospholipase/carboxylesterase
MSYDKVIERGCALNQASKALILLHGRGATAEGMIDLGEEFIDDSFYIVAPQAPNNAWYPYSFMEEDELNEPWLSSSLEIVGNLVENIIRNVPKENIFIMGFSQGACLALEFTARNAEKYGGVIAFSGGLIGKTINKDKYHGHFEGTKIFIGDSENDPYIPVFRCQESKVILEELGANVTLKIYSGNTHRVTPIEVEYVKKNIFQN